MYKISQKVYDDSKKLVKYCVWYFYDDNPELIIDWWYMATGNKESCYDNEFFAYQSNKNGDGFHIVKKAKWYAKSMAWDLRTKLKEKLHNDSRT